MFCNRTCCDGGVGSESTNPKDAFKEAIPEFVEREEQVRVFLWLQPMGKKAGRPCRDKNGQRGNGHADDTADESTAVPFGSSSLSGLGRPLGPRLTLSLF